MSKNILDSDRDEQVSGEPSAEDGLADPQLMGMPAFLPKLFEFAAKR